MAAHDGTHRGLRSSGEAAAEQRAECLGIWLRAPGAGDAKKMVVPSGNLT